jgi:glycerophosphoryl diester phosphodiesterase
MLAVGKPIGSEVGGMTGSPPGRIFISYRRQETAWPARRLYDVMVERFGVEQVFTDVDNIEPGDDFVERIQAAVGSCDVLLALIGPEWVMIKDETGQRRIDDPEDFVRLEIQTALDRHVRVIPILVDDARMPRASDLPSDLAPLVRRQAVEISPNTFNTNRLMATVDRTLATVHAAPLIEPPPIVVLPESGPEPEPAPEVAKEPEPEPEPMPDVAKEPEPEPEPEVAPVAEVVPEPVSEVAKGPEPEPTSAPEVVPGPEVVPEPEVEPEPVPEAGSELTEPVLQPGPEAESGPTAGGPELGSTILEPEPKLEPVQQQRSWWRDRIIAVASVGAAGLALVLVFLIQDGGEGGGTVPPIVTQTPTPTTPTPSPTPTSATGPDVLARRGGSETYPAGTLDAFAEAASAGYAIDADVRWTKDGVAVILDQDALVGDDADETVVCDGSLQTVAQTNWDDLSGNCAIHGPDGESYPIPTYAQAMEEIAGYDDAWVYLDVKTEQTASQNTRLFDVIRSTGMTERTVLASFYPDQLAAIGEAAAQEGLDLPRLLYSGSNMFTAEEAGNDGYQLWCLVVSVKFVTKDYVQELKAAGVEVVLVGIADKPEQWDKAHDEGADKIGTSLPEAYSAWLAERGL